MGIKNTLLPLLLFGMIATASANSFFGPDIPDDYLRVSGFTLKCPPQPTEGDTLIIEFTVTNDNRYPVELGSDGIFAAAYSSGDESFGNSFQGQTLAPGESRVFRSSKALTAGSWVVNPSYSVKIGHDEMKGPEGLHTVYLEVGKGSPSPYAAEAD